MKSTYKRLTHGQRIIIEQLLKLGYSHTDIALQIGCHKSSICRDARRCKPGKYIAMEATHQAASNSSNRRWGKCRIIQHKPLGKLVLKKLNLRWSPEQIHLYLKKHYGQNPMMQISMESIYFYIYVHAKPELRKLLVAQLLSLIHI